MTESGTCVPPGPSKNAVGTWSAEKRGRTSTARHYPLAVSTLTPPKERLDTGDGTGLGRPWQVIVLNDDHNTFEGVAFALSSVLPGVDYDKGMTFANAIHHRGLAVVWSGQQEQAELYWEQLKDSGLTMAPLEH